MLSVLGKMLRLVEDDADFSRFPLFPSFDVLSGKIMLSFSRFDELFSQVLKILPAQVENVQEMFDELSAMERSRKKSVILNTGQRHQEL